MLSKVREGGEKGDGMGKEDKGQRRGDGGTQEMDYSDDAYGDDGDNANSSRHQHPASP